MTTLPYDVSRCSGRFDLRTDGEWCPERDTCQRYLAWSKLDRNSGVTDYQRISVTMGLPDCGMKIPAEPTTTHKLLAQIARRQENPQ